MRGVGSACESCGRTTVGSRALARFRVEDFWRIDLRATAWDGIPRQSTAPGMSRYMHVPQQT